MNRVYLLIGGNLNDRVKLIKQAEAEINKTIGTIFKKSSIYESEPWGFKSEKNFLNQVLIVLTELSPVDVLGKCQAIENNLGRVRESGNYISRTMDIDILFYNNEIINNPDLIIPHKHLHNRRFTMEPLVELTPDFLHPILNKTLKEILINCKDVSIVNKV